MSYNLDNIINSDRINHAYLITVDELYDRNIVYSIISKILKQTINDDELIKSDYLSDIKIISPEGKNIKKDQISDLMMEFNNKSVTNNIRFYIIEYVEDLNDYSSNALLKFLEEPENNIIGLLITKNINSVLPTIVSRCQIINLDKYNKKEIDQSIVQDYKELFFDIISKKKKSVAYMIDLYENKSEELLNILYCLQLFYNDILKYKAMDLSNIKYLDLEECKSCDSLINTNDIYETIKRIEKSIEYLKYNVNSRIVLDFLFLTEE